MPITINVYEAAAPAAGGNEKQFEEHAGAINQIAAALRGLVDQVQEIHARIDAVQAIIPPVPPINVTPPADPPVS